VTQNSNLQRVWLILAKVTVVGDNPIRLAPGSEALVQCFVPETVLEIALDECDRVLERQGLQRTDVLKCISFEEIEPDDNVPNFVKRDVLRARSSGQAFTGTFFTSSDSASHEQNPDDSNSSLEN
jgi:hypothetical protein